MNKFLRVEMPDGSVYEVPAHVIARDRAESLAKKEGDLHTREYQRVYDEEFAITMADDGELLEWAANNMNWSDVVHYATLVPTSPKQVDFQEGWINGPKQIVKRRVTE